MVLFALALVASMGLTLVALTLLALAMTACLTTVALALWTLALDALAWVARRKQTSSLSTR